MAGVGRAIKDSAMGSIKGSAKRSIKSLANSSMKRSIMGPSKG